MKAGPGPEVDEDEELDRVVPAVEALHARFDAPLSVDTWRASVLDAACAAGAVVGNDISGFGDPDYLAGRREARRRPSSPRTSGCGRGSPTPIRTTTISSPTSPTFLLERARRAEAVGLAPEQIVLDAGLDLGKTPAQSAVLLRESAQHATLGYPLLLSASNKRFIGELLGREIDDRRAESLAAVAYGVDARVPHRARARRAGHGTCLPHDRGAAVSVILVQGADPVLPRPRGATARRRAARRATTARSRSTTTRFASRRRGGRGGRERRRRRRRARVGGLDRAAGVRRAHHRAAEPAVHDAGAGRRRARRSATPRREQAQWLAAWIADPLDGVHLVLVAGGGRIPSALDKACKAHAQVVGPAAEQTADVLQRELHDAHLKLAPDATKQIAAHLGDDAGRVPELVELLHSTYGDDATLSLDDVEQYLGELGTAGRFDLTNAIDRGDVGAALETLHRMLTLEQLGAAQAAAPDADHGVARLPLPAAAAARRSVDRRPRSTRRPRSA